MFDLFKSELKHYHKWAWLVFGVQIFIWLLIGKLSFTLAPSGTKLMFFMFSSLVFGFGFAMMSLGVHTRKSNWTYLLHRPIPVGDIHLALTAAALVVLFISMVLPFTLVLICLDVFTDNVVDLRHYLYCLHLFGITTVAYLVGCFFVLTPSKGALLAIWPVTYLVMSHAKPAGIDLLIDGVFIAITFYAVRLAFKANLSTFAPQKRATVVSALLLQPGIVLLLVAAQALYFHLPLSVFGIHPRLDTTIDSYHTFYGLESKQQYERLLAHSQDAQKAALQRQVTLGKFEDVAKFIDEPPSKGQFFMKDSSFSMPDSTHKQYWVFSHDQMVFVGRDKHSDKISGWLGANGFVTLEQGQSAATAFKSVPVPTMTHFIEVKNQLFYVDFEQRKLVLKHTLPTTERYVDEVRVMFDLAVVTSTQGVHLFDRLDLLDNTKPLTVINTVEHPISVEQGINITMTEVKEGYLLRYASNHYDGYSRAGASLILVPDEGQPRSVATTSFEESQLPSLIEFQHFMFSPVVVNLINGTLPSMIDNHDDRLKPYRYFWLRSHDSKVYLFCLLAALFSAITTWVLAGKMAMNLANRTLWTAMNAVLALPGLVAFLLLNPWTISTFSATNNQNMKGQK